MTPCAIQHNNKPEAAESAAGCVGTCDITNVSIDEVHLIAHCDESLVSVICYFYWYLVE